MADDKNRLVKSSSFKSVLRKPLAGLRSVGRKLERLYPFKSLTQLIIFLNLFGFAILVSGALYLNQFRAGLIDTKVQSLLIQGEIIASAIAVTAAAGAPPAALGSENVLELDPAQTRDLETEGGLGSLEFLVNPERTAPDFAKLIQPTGTRARIYDNDGWLVLDSDTIFKRGQVLKYKLPPLNRSTPKNTITLWQRISKWLWQQNLPLYKDIGGQNGKTYPEVATALTGTSVPIVRSNIKGELVVSVAVPIRRLRAVLGVLLLSTRGGEIDSVVSAERWILLRVALVAAGVTMLLSVLLARTIAGPMRRLSAAADRVRRSVGIREEIPDYTYRSDEIGHLSGALRDMTHSLYRRIEAIESFAADVSHELKNPLTSLRSAAETLPRVRNREARDELIDVIQHDVRRLDRLLTDISDASRLDAELVREDTGAVDMEDLLRTIVPTFEPAARKNILDLVLDIAPLSRTSRKGYTLLGHDVRLGQVIVNLLENAISFSPRNSEIRISAYRVNSEIEITVEDEGPGIPPENLEKIFDRFYTDRPDDEAFGQNSGLGLNISQQIISAHGGRIWAENRNSTPDNRRRGARTRNRPGTGKGARFVIRLPSA